MELTVWITPHVTGFLAETGAPLNLSALGTTVDDAYSELHALVESRIALGGTIRTMKLLDQQPTFDAAGTIGQSPLFEEWIAAVEDYRNEHNTIPEVE